MSNGNRFQLFFITTLIISVLIAVLVMLLRQGSWDSVIKHPMDVQAITDYRKGLWAFIRRIHFREAHSDYNNAEKWYVKCVATPTGQKHPCINTLQNFYLRQHRDLLGYDDYIAKVTNQMYRERTERISTTKRNRRNIPASFNLATLRGHQVSSDTFRGKVVVIKFWGLWCYPCRTEMPAFAKLVKKYQSVDDVRILTINNDPNADEVREWMQSNNYDFTVLLDDGYIARAGVQSFPMTWFLDKHGVKVFEHKGIIKSLEEELSLRIEALR